MYCKATPNLKVAIPTATPNLDRNVEMKSILTYSEQGRIVTRSWIEKKRVYQK
jgi:hypothetical protein